MNLSLNIKYHLKQQNMTQKELAKETGLRESTISEMANNTRGVINKEQLALIMEALDINRIEEVIHVHK